MKTYYLMHKDYKVALLDVNKRGKIVKVRAILNPERMPLGISKDIPLTEAVDSWLKDRGSTAYSDRYGKIYPQLGVESGGELLLKSNAVSLTDCYWLRPEPNVYNLTWSDVNFYQKEMSNDISLLAITPTCIIDEIHYNSPNLTTQGDARKFWFSDQKTGKMFMFKTGLKGHDTSVYSEIICGRINAKMGLNHIEYKLVNLGTQNGIIPCSVCSPMFVDDSEELITMQELINSGKTPKDILDLIYENNLEVQFYKMLVSDYITMNIDRNFQNFGVVRDPETLKIKSLAPLYDNTHSLNFDWNTRKIGSYDEAKPFATTHKEQIKLVKDFSWYDDSMLWGIETEMDAVLVTSSVPVYIREEMKVALRKRINELNSYIIQYAGGIKSLDEKLEEMRIEVQKENEEFYHGELEKANLENNT